MMREMFAVEVIRGWSIICVSLHVSQYQFLAMRTHYQHHRQP